jgi:hypothetical protein
MSRHSLPVILGSNESLIQASRRLLGEGNSGPAVVVARGCAANADGVVVGIQDRRRCTRPLRP